MVQAGEPSSPRDIHMTNGKYLQPHRTHDHQNWTAGTSKKAESPVTYQAATD